MNGPSAGSLTSPSCRARVMSAQLPGRTRLQYSSRPSVSVRTMQHIMTEMFASRPRKTVSPYTHAAW